MSKLGVALLIVGSLLLLYTGLFLRPEKFVVNNGFGMANADYEEQSADRMVWAIAGAALMVSGSILARSSNEKVRE